MIDLLGNFDVEVDKSKNLVPKMLDIFAAPDNGNMELRETASRAIRTTIGYGTNYRITK
jgi:hypothetical protein